MSGISLPVSSHFTCATLTPLYALVCTCLSNEMSKSMRIHLSLRNHIAHAKFIICFAGVGLEPPISHFGKCKHYGQIYPHV